MEVAYLKGFYRGFDSALSLFQVAQDSVEKWEQEHGRRCPTEVIWNIVHDFPSAGQLSRFYESDLNIGVTELIDDGRG